MPEPRPLAPLPPGPWEIIGSRRLTGPNLYHLRPGAVLEVMTPGVDARLVAERWRDLARMILDRLGWYDEVIAVRHHAGGVHFFTSAPLDGLLAATELNEQAWYAADAHVTLGEAPDIADLVARVRVSIQHDCHAALSLLASAAGARGLTFMFDDDLVSVGSGTGVRSWPLGRLPSPGEVEWRTVHDVPIALVTGSNGKTTTTRLIAAMLRRAGHVTGITSTDGVQVGSAFVAEGDYAGPGGARLALRDGRVTAAVLETARGGILRRGLAISRAEVAVVTRVAADHFGEYGVDDLRTLGHVKLVAARVVPPDGRVVLNADDPTLVELSPGLLAPIVWFSLDAGNPTVVASLALGGEACLLNGEDLVYTGGDRTTTLARCADVPLTLGGHARYNVANALAAAAAALALGASIEAVRATLLTFGTYPSDNPGRLTLMEWNGATIVVDFVHNPDGWRALYKALGAIPATRRIVLVGQAGDRDNAALRELAVAVWRGGPDVVLLKEMPDYLRGRALGETTAILAAKLRALGLADRNLLRHDDEESAIRSAIELIRPGDIVILAVHGDYTGAMRILAEAGARPAAADPSERPSDGRG